MADMEIDLLALLEGDASPFLQSEAEASALCAVPEPADDQLHDSAALALVPYDDAAAQESVKSESCLGKLQIPSMMGKVGLGRHGCAKDRALLTLHMRMAKALKSSHRFRANMSEFLHDSCLKKDGETLAVRTKLSAKGIVIELCRRASRGNRFKRAIPWCAFFQAAYGKLLRTSHIALAQDLSRGQVGFMSFMVSSVHQAQQSLLLAKCVSLACSCPPLLCVQQWKWDETELRCAVNADGKGRVLSSWQVMVARLRTILVWPDGSCMILRLVMPPVVLLATGAHHMFYALTNHPSYRSINELLHVLSGLCAHRVWIFEIDGAYSNDRLIAHLIQLNKRAEHKHVIAHVRCQNHQSQLINVALLSTIGHDILSRLYGMCVFIRNLGYWLRLRQAVLSWIDEHLSFQPRVLGSLQETVVPHPVLLELMDCLRCNRRCSSESDQPEGNSSTDNFERKLRQFLDMWNGDVSGGKPVHICSHSCLSADRRHCVDRADAVRKCANALLDLFMSQMPAIPAPNKWATIFSPLDLVLGGSIVHRWL